MRTKGRLLTATLLLACAGAAHAQQWPTKTVRVIVGFAVGVGPDVFLRAGLEQLSKRVGQSVVVENMTGGNGMISSGAAARAAPDGYTLYMAGAGVVATDRHMYKTLPYDPDKSFVPVSMWYVSYGNFAIAVHNDVPAKTTAELIALAKSQPGKLAYGTDTVGVTQIVGRWFAKQSGIELTAVPYKSPAQLMNDFIGGRTQLAITTVVNMEPFRKSGRFRILGVSSSKRVPGFEEIPTIAETLPGFKVNGYGVMLAPAGIAPDLVQRINREFDAVIRDPAFQKRVAQFAYQPLEGAGTPQSIAEFMRSERELWDGVFKMLEIQPQ